MKNTDKKEDDNAELHQEVPSFYQMAKNFTKSLTEHVANGMKSVSLQIYMERLDACNKCEHLIKKKKRCGLCGCMLEHKAKWETAGGGGGTTAQNWQTTNYTQATAPGCDFVFATASIAGGTYAVGDKIEVRSMVSQTNGTGTSYLTWAHSSGYTPINVGYPSGFKQLAGSHSGGNGLIYVQKTLYILSATETAVWTPGNSNETYNVGVTGGDPVEIYNIDWTVDSTIWYGACIDNAGHTVREFGGTVRKIN